jgi:Protein of unknown function (DUF3093)
VSTYSERLTVPWWAWPATLGGASFLAAELAIGAIRLRHPLTFIIACAVAAAGLFALSLIRVAVVDGELRVDDARLPVQYIGAVEVIDLEARRDLLGPDADPLAFVVQRPWISGGVRIDLDDPTDPTPYWYVSSRHPRQLAAALLEGRSAAVLPVAEERS